MTFKTQCSSQALEPIPKSADKHALSSKSCNVSTAAFLSAIGKRGSHRRESEEGASYAAQQENRKAETNQRGSLVQDQASSFWQKPAEAIPSKGDASGN